MTSYRPAWWLPDPHTATLWGKFGRREALHEVTWEQLATPDGDFVELAHSDTNLTRGTPRLLLLHGLEGGVHSHYVRGFMREAKARGWNATLMLFRTCGPTPNTLARSYHSGETGDLKFVIETLVTREPQSSLGVAAVSLGGNVLCKLVGESAGALPQQLKGAVAISTPFSLARASRHIGRGFGKVYELSFLRSLVPKAVAKIARHAELAALSAVTRSRTIWDFDDLFTSPLHGFKDAADYYARSSSLQFLAGIRIPTLLLNAVDDPFLPADVLDEVRTVALGNSHIEIEFPERGGHVGFTAGRNPFKPFYYGEWRAAQFLAQHFARDSAVSACESTSPASASTKVIARTSTVARTIVAALALSACNRSAQTSSAHTLPVTANSAVRTSDSTPTGTDREADSLLVNVQTLDSTIAVDMRYRNAGNFTGAPIPGYLANHAYLRREAASALARVQASLKPQHLGLKVWDAYRPVRATLAMVAWTQATHQENLVRDGYISDRSRHNLGVAIDLTLVTLPDGRELDMGTPHDSFASEAHTANASGAVAVNRAKLVDAMKAEGFVNYDMEWWHFSYSVPNPMRFDREVR